MSERLTPAPNLVEWEDLIMFCQSFGAGLFHSQRWGQAFCNHFNIGPWPELFYETDNRKAIDLAHTVVRSS